MQNDNKIAEITKQNFEEYIGSYQSRFESNLQKYLSDYKRETELYVNKKEELISDLFLDKKSDSLNDFEASVVAKTSKEISGFHKSLNQAKNQILKEIREDQTQLLVEFSASTKKFTAENKQKIGDHFVSEKTKFLYEVNKSKDRFKRDLEIVSSEVLEKSLESLHDLIGKQRELARSEFDSLQIFKIKEFSKKLDSITNNNSEQFKAEIEISLQYFVNTFEGKIKEKSEEIVSDTIIALKDNSKLIRDDFQDFSKRRLIELKEDFIEIINDSSQEVCKQTNDGLRESFEEMVDKIEEHRISFLEQSQIKSNELNEDVKQRASEINQEITSRVRHLTESGIENLKSEITQNGIELADSVSNELQAKRKVQKEGFGQDLEEITLKSWNLFLNKITGKKEEMLAQLSQQINSEANTIQAESEAKLIHFQSEQSAIAIKKMADTSKTLSEEAQSSILEHCDENLELSLDEISQRTMRSINHITTIFTEKNEILNDACIDLLQEAKREIFREFKEIQIQVNDEISEVKQRESSLIKANAKKINESAARKLKQDFSEMISAEKIHLAEIASLQVENFQKTLSKHQLMAEKNLANTFSAYKADLHKANSSAFDNFRESINIEINSALSCATEKCEGVVTDGVKKLNIHTNKKMALVNSELNKKIHSIKEGFAKIQESEDAKFIERINHRAKELCDGHVNNLQERADNISINKLGEYSSDIIRTRKEQVSKYLMNINEVNEEQLVKFQNVANKKLKTSFETIRSQATADVEQFRSEFSSNISQKLNQSKKMVVSLSTDFNKKIDADFNKTLQKGSLEYRQHVGNVYKKAVRLIDENVKQSVSKAGIESEKQVNNISRKVRHQVQAEIEKEVEKFGYKVDSIGKYLIGKIDTSTKESLSDFQGQTKKHSVEIKKISEAIAKKSIKEAESMLAIFIKEEIRKSKSEIFEYQKEVESSLREFSKSLSTNVVRDVEKESIESGKRVVSKLQNISKRIWNEHSRKYQIIDENFKKKAAYLERLLSSVSVVKNRAPKDKAFKSGVRPPQVPSV